MRRTHLGLSLAALGSSLALAASLVLPASAATGTASSGQLVATGTVTGTGGRAVPGAKVSLYAWPSSAVLEQLRPGQAVPRSLIATTTADSSGNFSLRVQETTLPSVAVAGGYANLEADSGYATWFFTRKAAAPSTKIDIAGAVPDHCSGWVFKRHLKKAWATVGQAYIWPKATHVSETFTYTQDQSTTLGVGISPTDKFGSFSASGTVTDTKGAGQGFPGFGPSNVLYRTLFTVGKFWDVCTQGIKYMVHPDDWSGGTSEEHPQKAPSTQPYNCDPEQPDDTFYTTNEKAKDWMFGLNISAVGFNGQAQTGYDSGAQVTFTFHRQRKICGWKGQPSKAAMLVAEP
jgi:hypothetical protein